jgi:hypothetical protein
MSDLLYLTLTIALILAPMGCVALYERLGGQ